MSPYAEYLLSRPKKPAGIQINDYAQSLLACRPIRIKPQPEQLTCTAAAKLAPHRYQAAWDEKGLANLSRTVSSACDRFFRQRGLSVDWADLP